MKKVIRISLIILFLFSFIKPVFADNQVNLYFFYGNGCPHCAKEEIFLDNLERENENIKIYSYEVWNNRENGKLLSRIGKELNLDITGVPVLIISDQAIVGYYSEDTTGAKIKAIISDYLTNGCEDLVAPIIGLDKSDSQCIHGCDQEDEECIHDCGCQFTEQTRELPEKINLPLIGEIRTKNLSLPALTIIIAAIDGFNPCAMWVLLFLISLLLGMKNRKRMWILGSTFIITSGLVYFLFLSAWLNLFLFLGFVLWIRIIISLVALISGGFHLRHWWRNRPGCEVTEGGKRKMVFTKLRQIISEKKFLIALVGIIILAFVVNLVELICSAGLPAVYTQVLALSNLASWQYYSYLILYIIIFMLDDLFVFFIAMATLQMKVLSSKYTRWSGLVGGVIMIIIGILLLLKPGWIMFG